MIEFFMTCFIAILIVGLIGRVCYEGDYDDYD